MNDNDSSVSPLPLWGSVVLFAVPTFLMWLATRHAIPLLRPHLGGPDVLCWFVAGGSVFICLFAAAFVAFWRENPGVSLTGFAERFRFRRIRGPDLLWSFGVLVICGVLSMVIFSTWRAASHALGFLPAPELTPPYVKMEPLTPETAWVLIAWIPLFFFNIVGEELWWRGYMLPRQERAHGRGAWLVHGLGLGLFHLPLGIDLTIILTPFLFGLPLVVQQRRNLWTGFIVHGVLNGGGFFAVACGLA